MLRATSSGASDSPNGSSGLADLPVRQDAITITVCGYPFQGPYADSTLLRDVAGVYVVACARDGDYYLIDVGQSASVKSSVGCHEASDAWRRDCRIGGTLLFFALYLPQMQQAGRKNIESELRWYYKLP